MNKNKIIGILKENQNRLLKFKYNGSRNKKEIVKGYIDKFYCNVFTIKLFNTNSIRCFSYIDILTKNLVISNVKFN